jgi:hypothetical protein
MPGKFEERLLEKSKKEIHEEAQTINIYDMI